MKKAKRDRLEKDGWRIGTVREFLELTDEESALIEIKLALHDLVVSERERRHVTQTELAKRMKSSQSRVAKIEGGDPSVSIDLLMRCLVALGMEPAAIWKGLSAAKRRAG